MRFPKTPLLRDKGYLVWLRDQPCVITGLYGSDNDAIDPAHIGTAGKGIKSADNHVLPVLHSIHQKMHANGEIETFRERLPRDVLRYMLKLYAETLYAAYKSDQWR
jgi:hypothetical protein